jgi:hypothetical protein
MLTFPSTSSTNCKVVISATCDPREFWRLHGATWHEVIGLHLEISDRLRALTTRWSS